MTDKESQLKAEKTEIESILEKGVKVKIGRWTFYMYEPYLGTLDALSRQFIDMEIDEVKLQENPFAESRQIAVKSAKQCSKVVAIAILNSKWKIRLLTPFLARYIFWKLKPSALMNLAIVMNAMSNFGDFTNSIRLMSGARTTAPSRIEENVQA